MVFFLYENTDYMSNNNVQICFISRLFTDKSRYRNCGGSDELTFIKCSCQKRLRAWLIKKPPTKIIIMTMKMIAIEFVHEWNNLWNVIWSTKTKWNIHFRIATKCFIKFQSLRFMNYDYIFDSLTVLLTNLKVIFSVFLIEIVCFPDPTF